MPGLSFLRKYGTVAASHENARAALEAGAAVLVYPGGDYEVHRPSWHRHRVDFGGRKGFIRLALDQDVPIVPVVAVGGQETALFLSRGESLAGVLGLDRLLRLKVLPVSLALPWVLNVGDMLGHIPLPAKITVEALPPIHPAPGVRRGSGRRRGLRPSRAADAGHPGSARRRAAAAGAGVRVAESIEVNAPPALLWGREPRVAHRPRASARSLHQLKRQVEHEQMRAQAAARREARTSA
jgi:hypothetical protein